MAGKTQRERRLEAIALEEKAQLRKMRAAQAKLKRMQYIREHIRYRIQIQGKRSIERGEDPNDWRSWRVQSSLPMLFHSEGEAWLFMEAYPSRIWEGFPYRKPSASVEKVNV